MPKRPKKPCAHPACPNLVEFDERYCTAHKRTARSQHDRQRPSANARGYGRAWRRYRTRYLAEHPLCTHCYERGILTPASVVDHITDHKLHHASPGTPSQNRALDLFWDPANHQPLCKSCHDRKTARSSGCGG